jgi:hypothetical protein
LKPERSNEGAPVRTILDLIRAHRKLILAALTAILPQVVDSQTADVILVAVGLVLTGAVPNDEDAKRRVYRRRR